MYSQGTRSEYIGRKINRLTVIGFETQHFKCGTTADIAVCECDCGKKNVRVRFQKLKKETVLSCGCHKKDMPRDIYRHSGEKYGEWTILYEGGKTPHGSPLFLCRCSCQNTERLITMHALKRGESLSCGCQMSAKRLNKYISGFVRSDNTSGINGVSYDARTKKWCSELCWKKQKYWLGRYDTQGLAVLTRKIAETKYIAEIMDEKNNSKRT